MTTTKTNMSRWECCECGSINAGIQGRDWKSRMVVPCSSVRFFHYLCGNCFDLDTEGKRIRHCDHQPCADIQKCDLQHCDRRPWHPENVNHKPVAKSANEDKTKPTLAESLDLKSAGSATKIPLTGSNRLQKWLKDDGVKSMLHDGPATDNVFNPTAVLFGGPTTVRKRIRVGKPIPGLCRDPEMDTTERPSPMPTGDGRKKATSANVVKANPIPTGDQRKVATSANVVKANPMMDKGTQTDFRVSHGPVAAGYPLKKKRNYKAEKERRIARVAAQAAQKVIAESSNTAGSSTAADSASAKPTDPKAPDSQI